MFMSKRESSFPDPPKGGIVEGAAGRVGRVGARTGGELCFFTLTVLTLPHVQMENVASLLGMGIWSGESSCF